VSSRSTWSPRSRQFQLNAQKREVFDHQGLTYTQTIPLAPEAVKLHVIIRDAETGRVGSLTVPLTQP